MNREQSIALHLAQKMGKDVVQVERNTGRFWVAGGAEWHPQHDRAQCMEVVEWLALNGFDPEIRPRSVSMWHSASGELIAGDHDGTAEGMWAAIAEIGAIATGWEETK